MCGQILGKLWKNSKGFSKTCPLGMLPSFLEQFLNLPSNQIEIKVVSKLLKLLKIYWLGNVWVN